MTTTDTYEQIPATDVPGVSTVGRYCGDYSTASLTAGSASIFRLVDPDYESTMVHIDGVVSARLDRTTNVPALRVSLADGTTVMVRLIPASGDGVPIIV